MDILQNVIYGFQVVAQPANLIYCFLGVVVGTLVGGVAAVVMLVRNGAAARQMTLPYGPFLALGGIIALFLS